jgi:hypothetical protein
MTFSSIFTNCIRGIAIPCITSLHALMGSGYLLPPDGLSFISYTKILMKQTNAAIRRWLRRL